MPADGQAVLLEPSDSRGRPMLRLTILDNTLIFSGGDSDFGRFFRPASLAHTSRECVLTRAVD